MFQKAPEYSRILQKLIERYISSRSKTKQKNVYVLNQCLISDRNDKIDDLNIYQNIFCEFSEFFATLCNIILEN